MYIKIINENITLYSIEQLMVDNSNVSFPNVISDEILEKFGVYKLTIDNKPPVNDKTQKIIDGEIVKRDNSWVKTWKIIEKSQEEVAVWLDIKSTEIRSLRNILLSETDFFALSDNTMTSEMASYRQLLRDITSQDGFPENIIWPVKPV